MMASAQPPQDGFWSIQLENDLLGSADDRFYTHGTQISFAAFDNPPAYLNYLSELLPFYDTGCDKLFGFSIGQKIFTPEDISQETLIKDDRPYAGWLYFNSSIAHRMEDLGDREIINGLVVTVGLVGPSALSENMQREVHHVFGSEKPRGWDNQLHDELGLNLSYLRKWRRIMDYDERRQFELSHHTGLTLGNVYSYASFGFMTRWGTHLKDDIGPPTISPGFPGAPAFDFNRQANWYLFSGIELRAMARNIFLDGNTFRNSHSVDKKPLVGDLQLGVAFHFDDMRIAYSQMYRSREFFGQPERTQYGAINLTFFTE